MEIRTAMIEDLPQLVDIYNEAILTLTATFDLEEKSIEKRKSWFDSHDKHYPLLVAVVEDKIAGYCSLSPYNTKEAYDRTAEISIYLSSDFRGQGIGKQLLTAIITKAKELNFHAILAGITGGNLGSVRLHEKFGFKHVGCFKEVGFKFGEWQDVHFYQLLLNNK